MVDFEKEKRRQRRLERLGTDDPRCGICGETDDRCLELHHLAGVKFDGGTVILCRNDHRKASDDQYDHPDATCSEPSLLERLGHLLLGIADLLVILAEHCRRFANEIITSLSEGTDEQKGRR